MANTNNSSYTTTTSTAANAVAFVGLLVEACDDWSLCIERGVLVVLHNKIVDRAEVSDLDRLISKYSIAGENVHQLSSTQFLMPGLIDTHIHAPQFPNAGLALDLPLLDWLEKYTFPTEAKFSDTVYANEVYNRCVKTTLSSGTTSAVYFASIHRDSSILLAKICQDLGQRAFVGKVCMDRNSPEYYCETTNQSLKDTQEFVSQIADMKSELIKAVITPRFVPSCTPELMSELGELAQKKNLHIQTHISENLKEIEWVKSLEPSCESYTQVYEKAGLLCERTILAHGVHLGDAELNTIRQTKAGISHCPNSNFSLKSGVCDVRRLKQFGVKVGLGTDCAGGYSPSLLNAMRLSILASNAVKVNKTDEEDDYKPLTYADAVYLATKGGAVLLGMEDTLGSLVKRTLLLNHLGPRLTKILCISLSSWEMTETLLLCMWLVNSSSLTNKG
jgi:guanine deaminase